MNRNQLFVSTLLVGMAAQINLAYAKGTGAGSPAKRAATSSQAHVTGGSGVGRTSNKATPKNFHSLTTDTTEKSHLERPGKNDREGDRQPHRENHTDHLFKGERAERGEHREREERVERERFERERGERTEHRYEERHYAYRGHEFDHRTYRVHGVEYHRFYQPYYYRGISFHVYAPGLYYAPAFYGWAYNPWAAPVEFEWGWAASPWYSYYGGWFRPYRVYASPSLWLTDYLVAQTLEAAYEARLHGATAARVDYVSTPMTPEVKQAIAEEVRRQIALENFEARNIGVNPPDPGSSGIARMLSDHTSHVFVVDAALAVASGSGTCSLSEGDVIQLADPTGPNATVANLVVLASKGNDCRKGAGVTIGLADLQEMQNHMRATIDQGLSELRSKQGQGLPAAPPSAIKPPAQAEYATIAPPADPK